MTSLRTRSRLPWDFRTRHSRRPIAGTPYRGYSYGRSRPTPSVRDTLYRMPWVGADTSWRRSEIDLETEVSEVPVRELVTKLHVTEVDLHVADNTTAHHTDMFECTEEDRQDDYGKTKKADLVVRRGQTFKITITFDRPYDVKKNDVTLVFTLGDDSDGAEKLTEILKLHEDDTKPPPVHAWSAVLESKEEKTLSVSIFIPPSAPVGEWEFNVRTIVDVKDGKDIVWQYGHSQEVIVLFNPWCKEDWVHLPDEEWLQETLLNDKGSLFFGSFKRIGALSWYFGQFEDGILDAALHLVRKAFGFEASKAMGNASRIVRSLSKLVNANDEAGVLIGRWGGDYFGGTSPIEWRSSAKILHQYMSTAEPVRYGQCWVFSGVLTTVCRALGIPCRSVTNFQSAHNSDSDHLSCDVINRKNKHGVWIEDKVDSVWNFHVWNEVWMKRPDLDHGTDGVSYDGWQVIDATPQERSDGVYQCGPTPVNAVKEGHLHIGQDTAFVFAEVNGDKVEWKEDPKTKTLIQLKRLKSAIGKRVSTNGPKGADSERVARLDLTDQYKYPEGSEKELAVVKKAQRMFRFANVDVDEGEAPPPIEALELKIEELEKVVVGGGFKVKVSLQNTGDISRTVSVYIEVLYVNYRGVVTGAVDKEKTNDFEIKARESRGCKYRRPDDMTFGITVEEDESLRRPQDGFNFEVKATAEVKESETLLKESTDLRLEVPDLGIEGPETCGLGDTIDVKVSYTNPLSVRLTGCKLTVDGNLKCVGLHRNEVFVRDLHPGETWDTTLKVKPSLQPRYIKDRSLQLNLVTDQLGPVQGVYDVKLS